MSKEDIKITEKFDTDAPVNPLFIKQEYECPKHGNVKQQTVHFYIEGTREVIFCIHCIVDMFRKNGVCEVKEKEHE